MEKIHYIKLIIKLMRFQIGTSKVNVKVIDKCNKITFNEYNKRNNNLIIV